MKITIISKNNPDKILAKAELDKDVLTIEGNYYFDFSTINTKVIKLKDEGGQYTCPIKQGTCDYYNLVDENSNQVLVDEIGWVYPKVANPNYHQIEGKMAFYGHKVEIIES